jgi:hypothetical protein
MEGFSFLPPLVKHVCAAPICSSDVSQGAPVFGGAAPHGEL